MTRLQLLGLVVAGAALVGVGYHFGHASGDASPITGAQAEPDHAPVAGLGGSRTGAIAPTLTPPRRAPDRELARDLHDSDPRVRTTAMIEYARDPSADPQILLAASRDPDLNVSVVAITGLGKLYASGNLPAGELISRATDRALPEKARFEALNGLGTVASADTLRLLLQLLVSADAGERRVAAALLRGQDRDVAVPALIGVLADPDDGVRDNALGSLRQMTRGRDFGTDAAAWRAWWQSRGT